MTKSDQTQQQFLDVVDRDEAWRRFDEAIDSRPLGEETVPIGQALGRVLAGDVLAQVDVPSFDRSNLDGFAVRAADTFEAQEEHPRLIELHRQVIPAGTAPKDQLHAGRAMAIATGGMLPRGADAIVMVEHADLIEGRLHVYKAVTPGFGVAYAGTDITRGETVLRTGEVLSSRETGMLAAVGVTRVSLWRKVQVAIISTGNEIIPPGEPMRPAMVYDSNGQILADAVRELGAEPLLLGIVGDELDRLRDVLHRGLREADVVLLSGGTSKGEGDLSYRVVSELSGPGVVAHGVALKPGKPICLAASNGKPVVVLPGFPTSAIFTFHEFVAPVIRRLGGRGAETPRTTGATMAVKVNSEIGRTEYLLVGLIETDGRRAAYPMGKGSGSVTAFSRADGFVRIDRHREIVGRGEMVEVHLLGNSTRPADLVVIGSHCVGLDYLIGQLHRQGFHCKLMAVGSTAGLDAVGRGECDLAGIHLLDEKSGLYNRPFLVDGVELIAGYGRIQGVLYRRGDRRFEGLAATGAIDAVKNDRECMMVNRNQGSGTRVLIDRLLAGAKPAGYRIQTRNHNAVAAAVTQGRADWGVAIESVAGDGRLGFLPLSAEQYDFAVSSARRQRPAVRAFCELLKRDDVREHLASVGCLIKTRHVSEG